MFASRAGSFRPWLLIVPGVIVVAAVYDRGVNLNLLYLSMILGVYVTLAVAVNRAAVGVVLLAGMTVFVFKPRPLAVANLLDPAHVDDRQVFTATIPAGDTWRYTFTLKDLDERRRECGELPPVIYVDGNRLTDATTQVHLEGAALASPPRFLFANGLDQIQIVPSLDGVTRFELWLSAKPGQQPAIRIGPEIVGGTHVYSDSVFLELKNSACTVLYQTPRRSPPTTTPGSESG